MRRRAIGGATRVVRGALTVGLRFPRAVLVAWLVAAAALTFSVPSLGSVVEKSSTAFLPSDAPTLRGLQVMDEAFGSGRTQSFVFVVFTNDRGLSAADRRSYRRLVSVLESEPTRVSEVQDYLGDKDAQRALSSRDGEATYLVVGLPSAVGSPTSDADVRWLRAVVNDLDAPPGTDVQITGDPAMVADLTTAVHDASAKVTIISLTLLVGILWLIYRRLATILVPLVTIGIALLCTRGALALAGLHGLSLSTYTDAFIVAITLGAGTDYCVFLISRFRESYGGADTSVYDAVVEATTKVGPALLASAATVILGAICLGFTKLAIFSTTGPPMAICVTITVAVSLTLTPALMRWLGPRIGPATPPRSNSAWSRTGRLVARRPALILAVGVLVLGAMALALPTMQLSYDERSAQPPDTPSNIGLAALEDHFPPNETLPDYLLITSERDMGNTRDLAVLNDVSRAVKKVEGVTVVRSITQPAGRPLRPASIAAQLGRLANGLEQATSKLDSGRPDLQRLSDGAADLSNGIGQVADGANRAQDATGQLADGNSRLAGGLGAAASKSEVAVRASRRLQDAASAIATGLRTAHDQVALAVDGLGRIVTALDGDPLCTLDPICRRSRDGLRQIYTGQRDQLLPGLARAADGANKIAQGNGQLADGIQQLQDGLRDAEQGSRRIAAGQRQLSTKLGDLSDGSDQLADGADQIAPGVDQLLTQTQRLSNGLGDSENYLRTVNRRASTPAAGGFYLPPTALDRPDFARARSVYLSPDGRIARIQVTGDSDPLTPDGLARFKAVKEAAAQSLNDTRLDDSDVLSTGAAGLGADLDYYLVQDAKLVLAAVLLFVFLILVLTLRALAAPLYLLASVVLSSAAALGLTTIVFQHLGGQGIHFSVPVITFVLLVAVGADYNILLMSRMREQGLHLTRQQVGEAVTLTGPVITSAGVIFASTFVALLTSPVLALAQTGFAVAAGLLLDTFVVRTLIVPACAALLEERSWWPTKPSAHDTRAAHDPRSRPVRRGHPR